MRETYQKKFSKHNKDKLKELFVAHLSGKTNVQLSRYFLVDVLSISHQLNKYKFELYSFKNEVTQEDIDQFNIKWAEYLREIDMDNGELINRGKTYKEYLKEEKRKSREYWMFIPKLS